MEQWGTRLLKWAPMLAGDVASKSSLLPRPPTVDIALQGQIPEPKTKASKYPDEACNSRNFV